MRAVFYLIFAVSGFAGLIYESIWTHYLKLFLGHAAYAQALVLAIFMGGMAAGSWLCSRYSQRWRSLLRGYAGAEAIIGLSAIVFHPVFDGFIELAYRHVIPNLGSPAAITAFKWTSAALLILPQTVLLGMTFPLMSGGILRRFPERPGAAVSMLYFANSLGGAIGVLASGFFMVKAWGLPGTVAAAGALNLVLAAVVWRLAGPEPDAPAGIAAAAGPGTTAPGVPVRLLLAVSCLTGLASFVYEIGWIRMLSLVLGGSTHAFELMLSAFIFGLAFGGLWIRRRIDRIAEPVRFLALVQLVMGACALGTLAVYNPTFEAMLWLLEKAPKTDAGYGWFNLGSHAIALAMMLPAAFCAGMTLPLITYTLLRAGHGEASIGAVYATNTVGAIAGVFLAVHFGMPLLGLKGLISAGAAVDLGLGVVLLWWYARGGDRRLFAGAAVASVAIVTATLTLVQLDPYRMASGVYRVGSLLTADRVQLVEHRDGKTATVHLTREGGGEVLVLRTNGKADASVDMAGTKTQSDEITMVLSGALGLLLHPGAKTAANIGFGSGVTTHVMLSAGTLERLDTVEIETAMVEVARKLHPFNALAYSDPRSFIHIEDAKSFFSAQNRKYDLIVSEPSNPWVSGVAGLFSEEFYRLTTRHLAEGGMLVQWLQLYEINFELLASVLKALGTAFSHYAIYATNHGDMLVVARNGGPVPEVDGRMFGVPRFAQELARVGVNGPQDLQVRKLATREALEPLLRTMSIRGNSDYYPVLDQNAARARFLKQHAMEVVSLATAPLPALDLLGVRPALSAAAPPTPNNYYVASELAYAAAVLHDAMRGGTVDRLNSRLVGENAEVLKAVTRTIAPCLPRAKGREGSIQGLLNLARGMGPFLQPAELETVWSWAAAHGCGTALAPAERLWPDLFKAVGRRDAREIAAIGDRLMAENPAAPGERQAYLMVVTALAHLRLGNRPAAHRILERYAPHAAAEQSAFLLRLLAAHSAQQPAQPATGD